MELRISDSNYPSWLKQIHNPPKLLHVLGSFLECDKSALAIVGSRNATLYGLRIAEQLAFELAEKGITIVSGLARGIDAASHKGALKAGGRTIAVLGSGIDRIYPKEHFELAQKISKQGCVISELANDFEAKPFNFPLRNRIISGLSLGVIVVEASRRSGSLITATHAIEQGRQVFAVPGHVDSLLSEGSHSLIKEGAILVESANDILAELAPCLKDCLPMQKEKVLPKPDNKLAELEPVAVDVVELLNDGPLNLEEIQEILGTDADIQKVLVQLELIGKIKRSFGATYEAC